FNLLLPTSVGGDVVRAWYLDGHSGRRLAAFVAVFLDRLSGLLVLIAMACVAVTVCPLELPAWIAWSVWGTACAAVLGLAALSVLWFAGFVAGSLLGGFVYLFGRFPRAAAPADLADEEQADDGTLGGDSDQGRARQFKAAA